MYVTVIGWMVVGWPWLGTLKVDSWRLKCVLMSVGIYEKFHLHISLLHLPSLIASSPLSLACSSMALVVVKVAAYVYVCMCVCM